VRGDSIQRGDIREAQLAERGLDNGNAGLVSGFGGGLAVDCFDDFVDMRGDEGIGEFEEVEFESGSDYGYFVLLEGFCRGCFAIIDCCAEVMGCG
jgi:hypothetical protein